MGRGTSATRPISDEISIRKHILSGAFDKVVESRVGRRGARSSNRRPSPKRTVKVPIIGYFRDLLGSKEGVSGLHKGSLSPSVTMGLM